MESYETELEKTVNAFKAIPKKPSEENIIYLGTLNHFETFEDDFPEVTESTNKSLTKRISLSGSIIVLDIDFNANKEILSVNISLSEDAGVQSSHSALSSQNTPTEHILQSLKEPRLDKFNTTLSFLSTCDRFSTRDVNCFNALDLISEAIYKHVGSHPEAASGYGNLVVNSSERLGFGMRYTPNSMAYLDIIPGSRPQFSLRNFKTVDEWLDENCNWRTDFKMVNYESRAELVLSLDPPVLVSKVLADEMSAVVINENPKLDSMCQTSSYHLRNNETGDDDDYTVHMGNMLPYFMVEISQVPLEGPSEIPVKLQKLRQFAEFNALTTSVLRGNEVVETNELMDMTISDALDLQNQAVHRQRIYLGVSLVAKESDLLIELLWLSNSARVIAKVGDNGVKSVEYLDHPNIIDDTVRSEVQKHVSNNDLHLVIACITAIDRSYR